MASTDDVSLLMPSIRRKALLSAGDAIAVRDYLRGARRPVAPLPDPPQPGRQLLQLNGRLRSRRQPQAQSFGIKWRPVVLGCPQPGVPEGGEDDGEGPLNRDVEQLKDQLLAAHLQSSRDYLGARLRTGRLPANRQFGILLQPVVLPAQQPPLEEPGSPTGGAQENEQALGPRSAAKPTPQQQPQQQPPCRTPATSILGRTPMEGVPERWLPPPQTCRMPATSVLGKTPMEGVPERWTAPRAARKPATPPLPTPIEGVPEGRTQLVIRRAPAARRVEEEAQQSVDSPIEGVVQQGARISASRQPAALADFTFASPLPPSPPRRQQQQQQEEEGTAGRVAGPEEQAGSEPHASTCDDELDDGGFDYGGNDEPSTVKQPRKVVGANPPSHHLGIDAAVQTGASLRSRAMLATSPEGLAARANRAVQAGASPQEQSAEAGGMQDDGGMDYGDDGYDAGGFDYDDSKEDGEEAAALHDAAGAEAAADWGGDAEPGEDQAGASEAPETSAQGARRRQQQRRIINHGARLRNELGKRKSLGTDPRVGRREVAPGVRRSTRQKQTPLEWWRGETKHFKRQEHKTMPTVEEVVHKTPNTPWRMVSDIYGQRKKAPRRQQQQQHSDEDGEGMEVEEN